MIRALELSTPKVRAFSQDRVGWIVLKNRERHNAISGEMFAAVEAAAEAFMTDDNVRVVAVRGEGEQVQDCWTSQDYVLGRAAFAERQQPEFTGT